jgi:hypothetical protein
MARLLAGQRLHVDTQTANFHYGIALWISTPAAAGINIYSFSFPVFFPFPLSRLSVCLKMSAHTHDSPSSTQNIVGVHYRVGKKIGEGSFGVIFEGPSLTP